MTVVDTDDFLATGEETLRALAELLTAFLRRASASYDSFASGTLRKEKSYYQCTGTVLKNILQMGGLLLNLN